MNNVFKCIQLLPVLAFLLTLWSAQAFAQRPSLRLSPILQRKMVVQQNQAFRLWGQAGPRNEVSVKADWCAAPVLVQADGNGSFSALLDVPPVQDDAFADHWIKVESQEEQILLDSLLIGDVWFCSGQSNMQFSLKEDKDAVSGIEGADRPGIRLFSAALNFSDTPLDSVAGTWENCTREKAADFSAVGYYMAARLSDSLRYPIGVIFSGIGASAAQAYVPLWALQNDAELNKTYLQPYLLSPKSKEKIDGGFSFEKVTRPYLLYNALIHPFRKFSVKGICWYQGESNHEERDSFSRLMKTMVKSWRKAFAQGELPFYYVQIAPYGHEGKDASGRTDAFFREAQGKLTQLNNVEMVSSMDVGDAQDLHPKRKRALGERLAAIALNRLYGRDGIVYRGPSPSFVSFQERAAIVHYEQNGLDSGLHTNDDAAPAFFELAGKDKIFYPAKAVIDGKNLRVSASKVPDPVALRYAFTNDAVTNLENKAGFPALPFRTDQWNEDQKTSGN